MRLGRIYVTVATVVCVGLFSGRAQADNPCAGGPPVDMNSADCCEKPALVDGGIIGECYKQYGEQTKKQMAMEGIPRGCCIAECAMNATGMYADGMLNRDDLSKMFMDAVKTQPEWMAVVRDATNDCFQMVADRQEEIEAGAKLEPSFDGEQICHPVSGTVLRCMSMLMFSRCPAGVYRQSEDCDKLREYGAVCPVM